MNNNSSGKQSSSDLQKLREIISNLRQKSDILEDELGTFKVEKLSWDIERRRLKRELEVQDDKLKDVTRDLSLSKEAVNKAVKRYDEALGYNREVEVIIDELRRLFEEELEGLRSKNEVLKEELEGLRSKNEVLVVEKAVLEGLKEELGFKLREKEGENDDLVRKCVELNCKLNEFKDVKIRNEGLISEITRLEAVVREKDERISELVSRNEGLENELLECVEGLTGKVSEIGIEKNGKIKELVREKECLEREKREIMVKYKKVEESFMKLEGDVVNHLCVEKNRDVKFGSSQVGKIIFGIMNALDLEQECGNLEEDPAFVRHANDFKCSSVTKSEEDAKTTMLSEEELSGENGIGAACKHRSQSPAYIQILDSDDDEISCHVSGLKRARPSLSVCSIQTHSNDSSSDGSLNQKRKIKKFEHVFTESAKLSTPHKQTVPFIRECNGNLSKKVKTSGLEDNDCNVASESNKTAVLEYMAKRRRNLENNILDVADMTLACKNDPEFCLNAVCALYRNGVLCSAQREFDKFDIHRGIALAKFLVDGDPSSEKKRTSADLKRHDPTGLDTLMKLAREYPEKLFEIFKSNEDPLFSHLSTDMKYR